MTQLIKNPVLRDRLNALAVFTGIAIGGVAGVEMVIGGGFDAITPAFAYQASEPRTWYDRPIAPGMGWLTEPYIPAATTLDVGAQFGDGYVLETYGAIAELDGAPSDAPTAYALTEYQPVADAELDQIVSEADTYVDEINDLYAESHAAEVIAREAAAPEAKLSGTASPL